ncbi:Fic/DOC family protein [Cytobacillus gottheilii]|uniref:Fic/DOC family protein n=1 Tax=Cytobacillus gottheilii TaxID=859144 RepID=UPI0008299F0D|nr:Fic family protein [Cytobacillus gottheilii]
MNRKQSKYCYPGTDILINNYSIMDQLKLDRVESVFTAKRLGELYEKPITGIFNLGHMQKIHQFIFQDVYDFAGKLRDVQISKGNTPFAYPHYIETYSKEVFYSLQNENYLRRLNINDFSSRAAHYLAEWNIIHPFREGNGRSHREFIRTLAMRNGYELNWNRVETKKILNASIKSVLDSKELESVIRECIVNCEPDFTLIKSFEESIEK